jgi:hypothetical protein
VIPFRNRTTHHGGVEVLKTEKKRIRPDRTKAISNNNNNNNNTYYIIIFDCSVQTTTFIVYIINNNKYIVTYIWFTEKFHTF